MDAKPTSPARKRNGREGKDPAFPFYAADWLADLHVRSMTPAQRGIYVDLLAFCWRERSIPDDPSLLARAIGIPEPEMASAWPVLVARFEARKDGRLRHQRLDKLRAERDAFCASQSTRANSRWRKQRETKELQEYTGIDPVQASLCSASASASASAISQSTAQTPPEVVKVREIPRDDPLSPDERHAMTTAGLVIKAIERLEISANGDRFQPGQWWGHSRKEKRRVVPMLATLEQLRRRLEAKDRPDSPWAYCEATYDEKRASYWADHAERAQAARKKEPAAPIVAELLGAAGAPGSKIGGR